MPDTVRSILARAAHIYDDNAHLRRAARLAARRRSTPDAIRWMSAALTALRRNPSARAGRARSCFPPSRLLFIKYLLCIAAALLSVLLISPRHSLLVSIPPSVLAFYFFEAHMVFLIPAAIDGSASPFRDSLRLTASAGGPLRVMLRVLPIAAYMLFGGIPNRRFLRAWCIGCLATCIWYESLHTHAKPQPSVASTA